MVLASILILISILTTLSGKVVGHTAGSGCLVAYVQDGSKNCRQGLKCDRRVGLGVVCWNLAGQRKNSLITTEVGTRKAVVQSKPYFMIV